MKATKWKIPIAMMLIMLSVFLCACAALPAVAYKVGSSGEQVGQIQRLLKDWGYYTGRVDGHYGEQTKKAVVWFQKKHGIAVDGIVGKQTAAKLGITLEGDGGRGDKGDVYLLARLVYGEARGESYKGKVAVAAVVLNRVESSKFPNSIPKVVYQQGAFSVVADGQINLSPDQSALSAARDAMNGWDPSGGAMFYYNPNKTSNAWMHSRPVIVVIGSHRFCK